MLFQVDSDGGYCIRGRRTCWQMNIFLDLVIATLTGGLHGRKCSDVSRYTTGWEMSSFSTPCDLDPKLSRVDEILSKEQELKSRALASHWTSGRHPPTILSHVILEKASAHHSTYIQ